MEDTGKYLKRGTRMVISGIVLNLLASILLTWLNFTLPGAVYPRQWTSLSAVVIIGLFIGTLYYYPGFFTNGRFGHICGMLFNVSVALMGWTFPVVLAALFG